MDSRILFVSLSLFSSLARSNVVGENDHQASTFGKVFEDHVLKLSPSLSLYTNGVFECAMTCRRLAPCGYFNYQSSLGVSGLCELYQLYLHDEDIHRLLLPRPGFLFVQMLLYAHSCLELLRLGAKKSGTYQIIDKTTKRIFNAYCDFASEPGTAWTLVSSRRSNQLLTTPFFTNLAIDEDKPNWIDYRLSLGRMEGLKNLSTHWRITCNLSTDEVDYRDYVRAKFSEVDIVHLRGRGLCKRVEYINIRGFNCSSCMAPWWQDEFHGLHTDSSRFHSCGAMTVHGSLNSEDNFGYYGMRNPAFRCNKDSESTTNWWFG